MADTVQFDYEITKANYLSLINKIFDEDSTHSEKTISKTIETLWGSEKTHLHKYYEVSRLFGRDVLMEKKKSPTEENVQVLSFEEVFDVFIKYHTTNNHLGGIRHLLQVEKQFKSGYNYPSVCLSLIVKSCNVCKSKSLALAKDKLANNPTKVSYVFVTVMIQKRKSPNFKHLLIYLDKATDFVLLRPLSQNSVMEIAMEIFKIMMTFGPPHKLCLHGYHLDFYKKVGITLRQVCSTFSFSIEYKPINYDPSAYVVNKLHEWMAKNISLSWEVGVSVVQKELNKTLSNKDGKSVSPEELFYGQDKKQLLEMNLTSNDNRDPVKKISRGKMIKKTVKGMSEGGIIEIRIPSPEYIDPDLSIDNDSIGSNSDSKELTSDEDIMKYEIEEEPIVVLGKKVKSEDTNSDQEGKRKSKRLLKTKSNEKDIEISVGKSNRLSEQDIVIDDNFINESDDDSENAEDPLQ